MGSRTIEDRFWEKVNKTDTCWLWTAAQNGAGYGQLRVNRSSNVYAHRFAYELLVGPIPEGLQLDHLCRVRNCCNPDHLEAVTPKVNTNRSTASEANRARHAARTECVNGHPFTDDNTWFEPKRGVRHCRVCARARSGGRVPKLEPVEIVARGRAAITHCPSGHEYDEANTYVHKGKRTCRECSRIRVRARRAALGASA